MTELFCRSHINLLTQLNITFLCLPSMTTRSVRFNKHKIFCPMKYSFTILRFQNNMRMNEVIKKTLKENSHPQLKCFINARNPLVQKCTISWRFPFYPPSSLLATFSCCFLVPLLQNLTLFLLLPFCPCSSLLAAFSWCFFVSSFSSTFTFSSGYLIIPKALPHKLQKSLSISFNKFLQTSKPKTQKHPSFIKKIVTHSCKQKPEYTQTDRQNQKTKLKNIKTQAHTNRTVNPSKITEKTLPKALLT